MVFLDRTHGEEVSGRKEEGLKAWGDGALWNLFFEDHAESEKGFSRICTKAR